VRPSAATGGDVALAMLATQTHAIVRTTIDQVGSDPSLGVVPYEHRDRFTFPDQIVREIERVVTPATALKVVPALERVATTYRAYCVRDRDLKSRRARIAAEDRHLLGIRDLAMSLAAELGQGWIGAITDGARQYIGGSEERQIVPANELVRELDTLATALQNLVYIRRRGRGTPADSHRHELNRRVGFALHEAGIRVTTTTDGKYANVLVLVYKALGLKLTHEGAWRILRDVTRLVQKPRQNHYGYNRPAKKRTARTP
jgi:hypothetical protein